MKHTSCARFGQTLFALLFCSSILSQSPIGANIDITATGASGIGDMKATFTLHQPLVTPRVAVRVVRAFDKHFAGAANVHWEKTQKVYVADFNWGGRHVVAWFAPGGTLLSVNHYGAAKHLPDAYRRAIASSYRGSMISATTQVVSKWGEAWIVIVQNCASTWKLGIVDGEVQELQHLQAKVPGH